MIHHIKQLKNKNLYDVSIDAEKHFKFPISIKDKNVFQTSLKIMLPKTDIEHWWKIYS